MNRKRRDPLKELAPWQDNAIIKPLIKGAPYKFNFKFCTGCGKCAQVCPCGYIEML